jgi:benzoyl-CoA reductase/2-hydroxyglutaryl-CoA dehydratase subunit BcrC/BadD/HgdB
MIKKILDIIGKAEDQPLEYDDRYTSNSKNKIEKRKSNTKSMELFNSWINENKKIISKLKAVKNSAETMDYYYEKFTSDDFIKIIEEKKKQGVKVVGTFCNLVPEELIYASGAFPIRLCSGCNDAIDHSQEVFPRDSCPLIKASVGSAVCDEPFFSLCDTIIIPATCDGKKKLGELLNNYKPVWTLDLPQSKERDISKKYWHSELRILKTRLQKLTKKKISRVSLKDSIQLLQKRYEVIRRLLEIRKSKKSVISGRDFFIVIQASFYDDINNWTKKTNELCDELEQNIENEKFIKNESSIRILLTGAPIIMPNFKIPNLIEEFDAIIAMDETCAGSQYMYDPVEVDEWNLLEMEKAIAERYLMPSVCPCFIKAEDRIDKLLDMIENYHIDAVIYHTLRLCLLFDIESIKVRDVLEEEGVPFLHINTDYSKEDLGQLRTRIEAFIEVLQSKK